MNNKDIAEKLIPTKVYVISAPKSDTNCNKKVIHRVKTMIKLKNVIKISISKII